MATKKIQVIGMKGPKGDPGATGPQGPAGPAGPKGGNGADGVGISSIEQTKTATEDGGENILTITLTNEEKTEFKVRNGTKGNPGDGGSGEGETGGGGLEYGIYVGDTQPTNGVMYWLDTSGDSGSEEPDTPVVPDEPDEPEEPEVTLSSISAVYTGGDVAVGTELSALTGITVTATYSDGSTANVTGYTLSGSIAEGSNTITVSYCGKTATFTVTGVAESGGGSGVDLSESNIFRSSSYNENSYIQFTFDEIQAIDVDKLYFYCEPNSKYRKSMQIRAHYKPDWSYYSVVKLNTVEANNGTNPIIPVAYDHYVDDTIKGYVIFEIDVALLKSTLQSLYDDGTLDSTKAKTVSIGNENNNYMTDSMIYLLYNYSE